MYCNTIHLLTECKVSVYNFTRKRLCNQRVHGAKPGFLVIELLQGVLILGVLLLLVSAFHVLSVHWQHQAIARFEALDALSSQLTGHGQPQQAKGVKALKIELTKYTYVIPECSALIGKEVRVEQQVATARWCDERGNEHSARVCS